MRKSNRLGCLTGTGILALFITSLIIAGLIYTSGGLLFMPGPLSVKSGGVLGGVTSHAQIAGNCKACHTAPWERATMADRCVACHANVASQIQNVTSLHGKLMSDNPSLSCRHCHSEHRGANAKLTTIDETLFPHEVVGFSLNGHQHTSAGLPFTCDDCHHGDISTFAPDSCQTCHSQIDLAYTQAHVAAFGDNCLACHDGVDRYGKSFNHNQLNFKLTGKHASVNCLRCHVNARSMADLQSVPQDCKACHQKDDTHQGRFGSDCGTCHTPDAWKPAKFDHNLAAFKLDGAHTSVKCELCHINNVYKGTPTACIACHQKDDHHNGQFGTDCAACHQTSAWNKVNFDHNKSNFPLTGVHSLVACEKCHTSGQFKGLSTACASCHADPAFHAGMFGTDCASCHTTLNWFAQYNGPHPNIVNDREHGQGIHHGGATCRDCHTQNLRTATCTKCHNGKPGDGGENGGGDN